MFLCIFLYFWRKNVLTAFQIYTYLIFDKNSGHLFHNFKDICVSDAEWFSIWQKFDKNMISRITLFRLIRCVEINQACKKLTAENYLNILLIFCVTDCKYPTHSRNSSSPFNCRFEILTEGWKWFNWYNCCEGVLG